MGKSATRTVGIIGNSYTVNDHYEVQAAGQMNVRAIADVTGALPLIVPALDEAVAVADLLAVCDGILLTGGRPNVHPEEYGVAPTEAHGVFDRARDRLTLPLVRACVEQGVPLFGICRGFQEMNVAFGGSLHPEIRDLPGRMNHRMPTEGNLADKFSRRHSVTLEAGGVFSGLLGCTEIEVNTLHGQGIDRVGARVRIEGHAPDGTQEALVIKGAPGFALGVQWHPEWRAEEDPVSRPLFAAFGAAMRA